MKTILLSAAMFTFGFLGAQVKSTEKQIIVEGKDTTTIINDLLEGDFKRQTIIRTADKSKMTIEDLADGTQKQTIIRGGDTTVIISSKSDKISLDDLGELEIDEKSDSTKIKLGKMKIVVVEDKDKKKKVIIDEKVIVENDEIVTNENEEDLKKSKGGKGEGHWSGFGITANGFLNADGKVSSGTDSYFLQQDYARSIGFNFNLFEKRFPIFREYVGLTTGLGWQWNRYGLKNNVDVVYSSDSTYGVENTTLDYKKNVLRASYIQVPLLLEFTTNSDNDKAWHLSAGVVGGIRVASSWKTKWETDGKTSKNKDKSTYNFQPFQAYATAMIGYGDWSLYVNYGLTEVFEKNKGPKFSPVQAGIKFDF